MMTRFDTYIINKLDYFSKSLDVLKRAEFEKAKQDKIYRMGVFCQFNLTFELAWKALQAVLRLHGAERAETGSPRELLQLGYKLGFVDDAAVWLLMLKKRNTSVHIYDEDVIVNPRQLYTCLYPFARYAESKGRRSGK